MKKSAKVLGVVLVLGVAYLGASWYVGKRAQAVIEQSVQQANVRLAKMLGPDLGGSGLKVSIGDYSRHVFSSDVTYVLEMKGADGKPIDFKLADHLQHGPFPFDALRSGDFSPMLAFSRARLAPTAASQKWFDSLKGQTPVAAVTKVDFSGAGHSQWTLQPLDYANGGDSVKFSGGKIDMVFSRNFDNSTITGQFDSFGLAQADDHENLQFKNIELKSKTITAGENDTQVQSSASADNMVFSSDVNEPLQVEKLTVNLESQQKNQLLDGALRYDFGRIVAGKADLGSISAGAKASHFDVATLSALANQYDAIKAKHGNATDEDLTLTDAESALLRQKFLDVLASNPSVSIDPLVWKNDKGQSTIALNVNLVSPADKEAALNAGADTLLPQILKLVTLDISISKPMFIKTMSQLQGGGPAGGQADMLGAMLFDQYLGKLQTTGLVKLDSDKAVSAIRYENNSIDANGKKMSVQEFVQRAMAAVM
ncbi:YdgA family protein [Paralcaligenes sp. KSB-10]|uniref:YdgA family protein n=1 Tax=Paralcaligenes sp. KSB-10 TaxID=2901142 RepID=UPI001E437445|nr:YdgA family protein [Paralcaligenes sp. KSB-10]UHL65463.1 YdgA family protein [Paralcaligenes sp. KSB-10]